MKYQWCKGTSKSSFVVHRFGIENILIWDQVDG